MDSAVKSVLDCCPSAKLGYYGFLDITDIIDTGFYARRTPLPLDKPFPKLETFYREASVPIEPLYVVNFGPHKLIYQVPAPAPIAISDGTRKRKKRSPSPPGESTKTPSKVNLSQAPSQQAIGSKKMTSKDLLNNSLLLFTDIKFDPFLITHAEHLKSVLNSSQCVPRLSLKLSPRYTYGLRKVNVSKVIAMTVARLLEGPDGSEVTRTAMEAHIMELKFELGSSLIPLGYLKLGGKFERALLFKTFADQLQLLCRLIRQGMYNAWVEIIIPDRPDLPLVVVEALPRFIVDLVDIPGRLMTLDSPEAVEYCSKPF